MPADSNFEPQEASIEDQLPHGVMRDLLLSPDRAHSPGQDLICSLNGEESSSDLQTLAPWTRARLRLQRRGLDHGEWLVLDAEAQQPSALPEEAVWDQAWHEARPIQIPSWAAEVPGETCDKLYRTLRGKKGLRQFLSERLEHLGTTFAPGSNMHLLDAERDRERIRLGEEHDLWVKASRLSTFDKDRSLRVRHSFGKEGADDASRDVARHRLISEFAEVLWPMASQFPKDDALAARLERWLEGPVLKTQHIAYFNAPEGGALWHHDAFDEPTEGSQRGVLYVQLSGYTAWLACPIDDLCKRVIEFLGYLESGEMSWLRKSLLPTSKSLPGFKKLMHRFPRLRKELGKPGGGAFAKIIGCAEFTALCADAGYAFLLSPGDALLLPNHGLERTAMHSVFCASPGPTLALSMGLREDREVPLEEPSRRRAKGQRPRRGSRPGRGKYPRD